jgi:hypothetical protein
MTQEGEELVFKGQVSSHSRKEIYLYEWKSLKMYYLLALSEERTRGRTSPRQLIEQKTDFK